MFMKKKLCALVLLVVISTGGSMTAFAGEPWPPLPWVSIISASAPISVDVVSTPQIDALSSQINLVEDVK